MAFNDRSAGITIDAVLTDAGREKIARNDGSFKIVGWVVADDEIDYSLFNPTTGSAYMDEDLLNYPTMEANVNEKLNINHLLMTITNPYLKYLPTLASDVSSISIGEEKGASAGVTVRFYQNTNQNQKIVPVEIQDSAFKLEMPGDLIFVENESAIDLTPYNTAIYGLHRDPQLVQASQGSQITFKVRVQPITNSIWDTFGQGVKPNRTITTKIKATGLNSGLSAIVTVTINEELSR